jgi:hypothetical protein
LPEEDRTDLTLEISTPEMVKEELMKFSPQDLVARATSEGKLIGEVRLKVLLKANALPQ